MKKQFFDARHPARDARPTIPQDERIARVAYNLIRGEESAQLIIAQARDAGLAVPAPNKSARVVSRTRSGMGEWVTVEASSEFFAAVDNLLSGLDAALDR